MNEFKWMIYFHKRIEIKKRFLLGKINKMGISGLTKIIKEFSKGKDGGIREVTLDIYKHKALAIDINIYLHGFVYNPTKKKPSSHIDGFFQMICDLLKHQILPIMVFDGKPPDEKSDTCKDRSDTKKELQNKIKQTKKDIDQLMDRFEKLEQALSIGGSTKYKIVKNKDMTISIFKIPKIKKKINTDTLSAVTSAVTSIKKELNTESNTKKEINIESKLKKEKDEKDRVDLVKQELENIIKSLNTKHTELEKYTKRDIKITSSMYTDLETLFKYMGIPNFVAKGEADALCVRLFNEGWVAGVLSEDMDILPFGGNLIRGIKEKRILTVNEYNLSEILTNIGLNRDQLVDVCVLCGCDYSPKIKNIGPKGAINLILKHKNIEEILDKYIEPELKKTPKPGKVCKFSQANIDEFKNNFQKARKVFIDSPKLESTENIKERLKLGEIDKQKLLPFLKQCRYRDTTLEKKMAEIAPAYSHFSGKK